MMIAEDPAFTAPSKRKIITAAVVALAAALAILFIAILPAEYGIDPLGAGALLGLTELAEAAEASPAGTATPADAGIYTRQPSVFKTDAREFVLKPKEGIEFKYHMDKGAAMLYSWKATGFVQFEFHGEPDKKPNPDYYDSYEKNDTDGNFRSYGSFIAPSSGIHGWYWENKTDKDVTVRLTTSGFFNHGLLFGPKGVQQIQLEDVK